jgi:hypothetical protein
MSIINKHLQHLRSRLCEYKQIRKDEIPSGVSIEVKSSIPTSADILELFKQNIQPAEYIQVSTNNWYYRLDGKAPSTDILLYGELAVSYQKGYEKVFFKNSENELVSLQPITYTDSTVKGESNNVDVEVKQENGKLTNVVVTDRTDEAIENAIQQLDSTVESTDGNINVKIQQIDGKLSSVVVTDKGLSKKLVTKNPELTATDNQCEWIIPYQELIEQGITPDTAIVSLREISTGKQVIPDVTFREDEEYIEISFHSVEDIEENKYLAIIIG